MHAYIALKKMEIAVVKGKQHAGTEFHNLAIFRNKLLATSVPPTSFTNVDISEGQNMYRG